jgi:hypothetical protein
MTNVPDGTPCDDGLFCTATDACSRGACTGSGSPCPTGPCAAGCDEASDRCAVSPRSTICRAQYDICDQAEYCDGVSPSCPPDVFQAGSPILCRESEGPCDPEEICSGTSPECPPDVASHPDGYPCDLGLGCGEPQTCWRGVCVRTEFCDYSDNDCDGTTDEGVGCVDVLGEAWCPGDWSAVDMPEVCAPPASCQLCECTEALLWESCDPECFDCSW